MLLSHVMWELFGFPHNGVSTITLPNSFVRAAVVSPLLIDSRPQVFDVLFRRDV